MSFKLDISKMKYLKSDDKSTTFQHPAGHTMTIAHNILSPKAQAVLKAAAQSAQTPSQSEEAKSKAANPVKLAAGGQTKPGYKPPVVMAGQSEGDPPPVEQSQKEKLRAVSQGATGQASDSNKSSLWDNVKNAWADGGQVPVPQSKSVDTDKQQRAQQISQGAKQAGGVPSDSPLSTGDWSKLWAEGGRIPQMRSQHGGDGNVCEHCGEPVHKSVHEDVRRMADGGDIGGVQQIIPQPLPENDPRSLDMASKRKEYNDIVAGHNAGFFGNPEDSGAFETKRAQFSPDGQPPQQFDPKVWEQMENERGQAKQASAQQLADEAMKTAQYNQAAQQAGIPPKPTDDIPGNMDTNSALSGQSQSQDPAPQQPAQSHFRAQDPLSNSGFNDAVNSMADIQQKQLAHQIDAKQQAMDTFNNHYAELDNERKAHIEDIQAGHIDPNKYWDDHSKVASGIGMILAGFNPTSQPNAAINFLQHQMDKSMEAQKANLESQNNLLSANLHQFGNLHQATLMTQAMMNDALGAQMQQAALQAKNPLAKQAALGASGQLMQQAALFQRQLAMQRTMMQLANGGGGPETQAQAIAMMSAVNPEGAKVYRDAFVPGIGMSKSLTPIPEEVRQQLASGQKLQNAAQDLLSYSKQHTNLNPMSAEYKVGTQKALILQQMVREGMLGTVFRDSEKPLLNAFVAENPAGALKRINSDPKLRTLLEASVNQMNTLKQTYGLPQAGMPQGAQQPQYKIVNGVKYMRGPNGQAIPVK